jgi:hypothetical protein
MTRSLLSVTSPKAPVRKGRSHNAFRRGAQTVSQDTELTVVLQNDRSPKKRSMTILTIAKLLKDDEKKNRTILIYGKKPEKGG